MFAVYISLYIASQLVGSTLGVWYGIYTPVKHNLRKSVVSRIAGHIVTPWHASSKVASSMLGWDTSMCIAGAAQRMARAGVNVKTKSSLTSAQLHPYIWPRKKKKKKHGLDSVWQQFLIWDCHLWKYSVRMRLYQALSVQCPIHMAKFENGWMQKMVVYHT